jgi:uncharacterized protein
MFQLSESDQQRLLKIARTAVLLYLSGKSPRPAEIESGPLSENHSVFVSLHEDGELRGCIGNLHATAPLYRTTAECAIQAAVADPRFMPLTLAELVGVAFEISVLSPLEKVDDINTLQTGRDGIFIIKNALRGLLLPQVATDNGWDRERFLAETCRKAGLKSNDWKDGAAIFRFTAQIIAEKRRAT